MEIMQPDNDKYKQAIVGELSRMFEEKGFISHESSFKKLFFNEVTSIVAIVGFVSSIIFWVQNPQNTMEIELTKLRSQVETNKTVSEELSKIKNNDLNELSIRLGQIEDKQDEIIKSIVRLETKLSR